MRRNLAPGCISSDVKLCQRKPLFPFFRGPLFLGPLVFFFFLFFLSPAKVGSLEMQPGAKLQAYLGVSILQPHASVLDFESFAGRGQMLDGQVLGTSQVEYKPFGKPPLKREPAVRELSFRGLFGDPCAPPFPATPQANLAPISPLLAETTLYTFSLQAILLNVSEPLLSIGLTLIRTISRFPGGLALRHLCHFGVRVGEAGVPLVRGQKQRPAVRSRSSNLPSSRSSGPLSEAALLLEICSLLQLAQFFVRKRSSEKSEVLVTMSVLEAKSCGAESSPRRRPRCPSTLHRLWP